MEKERKMQVATFRFGVIAILWWGAPFPGEKERLLREKSERAWSIPFSGGAGLLDPRSWVGCDSMSVGATPGEFVSQRPGRSGTSRALDEEVALVLRKLRYEMPTAPVVRLFES